MEKHEIVVDTRYVHKPEGTGAWGDSDVVTGYHCTQCGAKGETREEINKQDCQPKKG